MNMFPTLHGLNLSLSLYYPYISLFIYLFIYLFAPLVFSQKTNLKGKKVRGKMELREWWNQIKACPSSTVHMAAIII
jgi:hypothetical protein